jgi:predicted Zn-dependent peptidase
VQAPVQADRTGDSIAAVMEQVNAFLDNDGVRPAELSRNVLGNMRQLPGQFETSPAVLGALQSNALYNRPDNYWETIADRYRGMTAQALDQTARQYIDGDNFVWVVVGDAAEVRPQLQRLGLPIEVVAAQ